MMFSIGKIQGLKGKGLLTRGQILLVQIFPIENICAITPMPRINRLCPSFRYQVITHPCRLLMVVLE